MMKIVLKLDILDEKTKQKVMKNVSCLSGVDSLAMDMKDKKLTVTGDVDPVTIVSKLRKICNTEIVSVGPAKEPEKKKNDGGAAAGAGGGDKKKKEDDKKKGDGKNKEEAVKIAYAESAYYHQPYPYYYQQQQIQQPYYYSHPPAPYYSKAVNDENPNCVIC